MANVRHKNIDDRPLPVTMATMAMLHPLVALHKTGIGAVGARRSVEFGLAAAMATGAATRGRQ